MNPRLALIPRHWVGLPVPREPGDDVETHPPREAAVPPGRTALATQLKKGMPALVVLTALADGEQYGYGLRRATWIRTRGLFHLTEGALYALLGRLERRRLVRSRREAVGGRTRRYYALTPRGRAALAETRAHWQHLRATLDALLR